METRPSTSNPPSLSGPDDEGFWIEEDFSTLSGHSVVETRTTSQVRAVITKYYTVMDDDGPDEVFVTSPPAEGAAPAEEGNTCVTLVNGAADATEAAANPGSLPWHHGEQRLRVAHGEVEEVRAGAVRDSAEERKDSTGHDQESVQGTGEPTCEGGARPKHDHEEIVLGEEMDLWRDASMEKDQSSKVYEEESDTEADQSASEQGKQEETTKSLVKDGGAVFSTTVQERGTSETKDPDGHDKRDKQEKVWGIATKIKQGEELLQRLQLVQLRQDDHRGEGGANQRAEEGAEQNEFGVADMLRRAVSNTEETAKSKSSVASITVALEHQRIVGKEPVSKGCTHGETSPILAQETTSSLKHRFSTAAERQTQENRPRSDGVLDLSENPDVLEIPFKSPVVLEPKPEHPETAKELNVPFILEKVQSSFSKGEVSQLQETKMLFEAFQQASPGGPTRPRKAPSAQLKAPIYPTVLERTRSLEGLSLKSCPVSRAHSLRLLKSGAVEREKSPDNLRARSPNGGPRDKTRLSPYPKQDVRLYRSMDSISASAAAAVDSHEDKQDSPLLTRNPFFKLRPALAKQPMVEKDIREAKEREEELRRQRCYLYRENHLRRNNPSPRRTTEAPELKQQSRGKLVAVWPPPSKKDLLRKEQTEQEPKVQRAAGQKTSLWQRWESGQINTPRENN